MGLKHLLDEDRRLVLLRSISDCGGKANESILQTCLDSYGHYVSRDEVRRHLSWLDENRLVSLSDVGGCMVASLTRRGTDVGEGRVRVPGVKRPRFGDE
ncbi:hypothetical protein SOASR030_37380 [Leminorella grimontii]|uniref:ArsR family transcriptional regulator n=2 Tax=Leminorella TaxID=82980 RepID=A0A2X4U5A0_9GAMM|nr:MULTISPECIES: hypothetical protein [Leminorella]KFC92461.1 hypothetical protein GLGR_3791 [Leminorella grimontii ATCC 33999 = DSM 5078]SQI34956.1 Uncharacterised protein [Leminorella richardii]VFS54591.1 Uncharacterised protein [Leminorella grimontii]VFS55847.1 Uncharacterised protein [Leminorella grimontii]GKX57626.1 hypothetical protein SOASR030_37380 [Leminorella grimontii]